MFTRGLKFYQTFSSLPATTHEPQPFNGNAEEIIAKRNKHFSNIYSHYYKNPLLITEGHLQYLFDHQGNRYLDLDANGGTATLGHSHPALTKIVQDQSKKLVHTSTIYATEYHAEYSKLLLQEFGEGYECVYLCNTTGEAVDFSLNISRIYTEERDIFAYRNAYHSVVGSAKSVTSLGSWSSSHLQRIQCERLPWPAANASLQHSVNEVREIFRTSNFGRAGVLIYEPLQTKNGVFIPPTGYLKEVDAIVKRDKGLTISDESATGVGRIGKETWGFKWQNTRPDIIVAGQNLTGGSALSAVITRKEVASSIKHVWFNTFATGPIQTRLGIQVLNVIKKDKLNENAEKIGQYLLAELQSLAKTSDHIGEVRGKGLLIGFDIVSSKLDNQPCKQKVSQLLELTRERQLLLGRGGTHGNVLLVHPPLSITLEDAKYAVQALGDALSKLK